MRISRWLPIVVLLLTVPGCAFDSDGANPTATSSSRQPESSASAADDQFPTATIVNGHVGNVSFMAWSPDGTLLATAADGLTSGDVTPRIWDAAGTPLAELTSDGGTVTGISWSADGSRLAGGLADGQICLWDVPRS